MSQFYFGAGDIFIPQQSNRRATAYSDRSPISRMLPGASNLDLMVASASSSSVASIFTGSASRLLPDSDSTVGQIRFCIVAADVYQSDSKPYRHRLKAEQIKLA